jgi:hypothetical protein
MGDRQVPLTSDLKSLSDRVGGPLLENPYNLLKLCFLVLPLWGPEVSAKRNGNS